MRHNMYYPPTSRIGNMCAARLKYNEALNTAVAEVGHNIMNITDCSEKGDFNNLGQITTQGTRVFWQQVDFLLEQFDARKIKLLPAPVKERYYSSTSKEKGNHQYRQPAPTRPTHF